MKVISAAALALPAAAQARGSYHEFLPALFRGSFDHRSLATSQLCLDETADLFEDDSLSLSSAFEAVNDEIDGRTNCNAGVRNLGRSTCEVDFDVFDSFENFHRACADAGGKTVEVDAEIVCAYSVSQVQTRDQLVASGFTFRYDNLVDCVSSECDDEGVRDKIEEAIAKAASTLGASLDATCIYRMEEFQSSSAGDGAGGEEGTKETPDIADIPEDAIIGTADEAAEANRSDETLTQSNGDREYDHDHGYHDHGDGGQDEVASPGDGEVVKDDLSSSQRHDKVIETAFVASLLSAVLLSV